MHYQKTIRLKDGMEAILRNADGNDTKEVLELFCRVHGETDYLTSYADETTLTEEGERQFLAAKAESENEIELIAFMDGKAVGSAGITALGKKYKIKHRATFGVSVLKDYWGLGIGRALTEASIACAKAAGYKQIELEVVSENAAAVSLYRSVGFVEYGRNPRAFFSRRGVWQENLLMRLELDQ